MTNDPYKWVMYSFKWGEGELTGRDGPDEWQTKFLKELGEDLRNNLGKESQIIQDAIKSGHGIGKSCTVSWIILWAITTFEDTKIVVTANTENQLKTKTWSELAKWYRLCWYAKHLFKYTATSLFSVEPDREKTWRADMIPWSLNNTEAFAGLHNEGKRILVVFDEASAIPREIWEVTEGALTDQHTQILWFVFGNPTKNTGSFRECFGSQAHRWRGTTVDSRTVKITNKEKISQWVEDYGEDSDFVRVRVKGVFPRAGNNQFISSEDVERCLTYKAEGFESFPIILGVDIARFGDDQNVLVKRQGRKVTLLKKWRGLDLMASASIVARYTKEERPDIIFVDGDGVGGGVVDRLKQLVDESLIFEVHAGAEPSNKNLYFNKRAEMWGKMNEAIKAGIELPNDNELIQDLTGAEYGYNDKNLIQVEKKADMKKRGLSSPDCADALMMTWCTEVYKKKLPENKSMEMMDYGYLTKRTLPTKKSGLL
jgi:hypothetical protein